MSGRAALTSATAFARATVRVEDLATGRLSRFRGASDLVPFSFKPQREGAWASARLNLAGAEVSPGAHLSGRHSFWLDLDGVALTGARFAGRDAFGAPGYRCPLAAFTKLNSGLGGGVSWPTLLRSSVVEVDLEAGEPLLGRLVALCKRLGHTGSVDLEVAVSWIGEPLR